MAEVEPNNSHQNKEISNNKKKHLPKYAQFLLTGIAGAAIGAGLTFGIMEVKELKSPFYQVEKVYEQLQGSYYKKVSPQTLRQGAINGMLIHKITSFSFCETCINQCITLNFRINRKFTIITVNNYCICHKNITLNIIILFFVSVKYMILLLLYLKINSQKNNFTI